MSMVASLRRLWFDPNMRSLLFQVLTVFLVGSFFYNIISNAVVNLEQRGITTGFEFLNQTSGFGIIQSLIDYNETHSFGATFTVGILNTLLVSVLGIVFATLIGFVMGIARLSNNWLIAKLATLYIETVRNIPLLLQIFFWYFAVLRTLPSPRASLALGEYVYLNIRGVYLPKPLPEAGFNLVLLCMLVASLLCVAFVKYASIQRLKTGRRLPSLRICTAILASTLVLSLSFTGMPLSFELPQLKGFNFQGGVSIIPELAALLLALTIYTAAFIAEIVRSGILAVNKGQTEAAKSLGLSQGQTLKLVVIPQALRVIIPPLTSQYLNLTKNSSLATAIGYPDLVSVFMGTTLNQTGQAIEVISMTMAVYLSISLLTSFAMNIYNKKVAIVER